MTVNEAIGALNQIANVFRATQDLTEALEVARQVESDKAVFEAQSKELENRQAELLVQRKAVDDAKAKLDDELDIARKSSAAALINLAEDERLKREAYALQTQRLVAEEDGKRDSITQILAGLEKRRDDLEREIHQLEDKRDDLKGLSVAAPSAQVRLPHE